MCVEGRLKRTFPLVSSLNVFGAYSYLPLYGSASKKCCKKKAAESHQEPVASSLDIPSTPRVVTASKRCYRKNAAATKHQEPIASSVDNPSTPRVVTASKRCYRKNAGETKHQEPVASSVDNPSTPRVVTDEIPGKEIAENCNRAKRIRKQRFSLAEVMRAIEADSGEDTNTDEDTSTE